MVYSNKQFKRHAEMDFPPPPKFLVWRAAWGEPAGPAETGELRHFNTLQNAKKYVSSCARKDYRGGNADNRFRVSWDVYEWSDEDGQYHCSWSGDQGDRRDDNPLFSVRVQGGGVRQLSEKVVNDTLASIMGEVKA